MTPNIKNRRRRRNRFVDGSIKTSWNLSLIILHVTMASIYNIFRTSDAFRMASVKQIRTTSTSLRQSNPKRTRKSSSSSSSLYVLSSPRRRTSSTNNSISIPSPIEFNTNLMINFHENNGKDSNLKKSASSAMPLTPVVSTIVPTVQAPHTKEISTHDVTLGAASKSSLFRRQYSSAAEQPNQFYPSPKISFAASTIQPKPSKTKILKTRGQKRRRPTTQTPAITEVTTVEELNQYWPRCLEEGDECPLPDDEIADPGRPLNYNKLLRGVSVKGDTQIIGSKDHLEFVHPVVRLMYERKKQQEQEKIGHNADASETQSSKKKDKIALVVEGGGMRGCVSAGMCCAIHCLGLSDTVDVVYGSSAGAVIAAYFVSKQLPYYGPEVYYDSLTTMEDPTSINNNPEQAAAACSQSDNNSRKISKQQPDHVVDSYDNDYFIDLKRMTRSMGLGLCDPRLLKDVWTRRVHGKPMMNLHYMFQNIMLKKKPIDYETFVERQATQPLRVVTTGLSSEKAVVLSHEDGHFDTVEDLCNSLHASCLLPGIAGPVMNVLKHIRRSDKTKAGATAATTPKTQQHKPNFVLRNTHRKRHHNDEDYEPLGDAMLSAPIPYDIAHEEGATHVLVIRSSPDGTNLMAAPSIMAWIGSMIFKRYFLKKNHLPGMYKRSQTEQRHQRVYANAILELNERANFPPPSDSKEDQTMTIALEPGSDEVSHLETTREGIFKGVRQGFARAYDALVEDPTMRGKGKEMALLYFPDEILEYDPNDSRLSSSSSPNNNNNNNNKDSSEFRSAFEEYLSSTGVVPKAWLEGDNKGHAAMHATQAS